MKKIKRYHNSCANAELVKREIEVVEWYRLRPWKLSIQQLTSYQGLFGHKPIIDRKKKTVTFDENAILKLMMKYKDDPLYPLILEYRKRQKLLTTYVGQEEYLEVEVPDDYILMPGEKLAHIEANG